MSEEREEPQVEEESEHDPLIQDIILSQSLQVSLALSPLELQALDEVIDAAQGVKGPDGKIVLGLAQAKIRRARGGVVE